MPIRQVDSGVYPLDGQELPVSIRVDPRARRLILRVGRRGDIRVTCPAKHHVPSAWAMIDARQDWIRDRLHETPPAQPFIVGAVVPVDGNDRTIIEDPSPSAAARLEDDAIRVGGRTPDARARRVEELLRRLAQERCQAFAEEFSAKLKVSLGTISVRSMSSRWGSCAADGNLSFSWRLILAPPAVLRYVVAHEVAHRIHMNHSRSFWQVVAQLDPDYRSAARWLKDFGSQLHAYGVSDPSAGNENASSAEEAAEAALSDETSSGSR